MARGVSGQDTRREAEEALTEAWSAAMNRSACVCGRTVLAGNWENHKHRQDDKPHRLLIRNAGRAILDYLDATPSAKAALGRWAVGDAGAGVRRWAVFEDEDGVFRAVTEDGDDVTWPEMGRADVERVVAEHNLVVNAFSINIRAELGVAALQPSVGSGSAEPDNDTDWPMLRMHRLAAIDNAPATHSEGRTPCAHCETGIEACRSKRVFGDGRCCRDCTHLFGPEPVPAPLEGERLREELLAEHLAADPEHICPRCRVDGEYWPCRVVWAFTHGSDDVDAAARARAHGYPHVHPHAATQPPTESGQTGEEE